MGLGETDTEAGPTNGAKHGAGGGGGGGARRLTARQRRQLKKGGGKGGEESGTEPLQAMEPRKAKEKKEKKQAVPQPKELNRGQRRKANKIKRKYRDQDEEERDLRISLLGNAPSKKDAVGAGKSETGEGKEGGEAGSGESGVGAAAHKGERASGSAYHDRQLKSQGKTRNKKRGGGDQLPAMTPNSMPEMDGSDLAEIESLTSHPKPGEEILGSIPCCAPYSATQSWKYRVKVTPGTQKKGKASKVSVDLFDD